MNCKHYGPHSCTPPPKVPQEYPHLRKGAVRPHVSPPPTYKCTFRRMNHSEVFMV